MHINKSIIIIIKTYINTEMIKSMSKKMKIISYSIFIILLDQVSKFLVLTTLGFERSKNIIPNLLNFSLVKNKGAAFSLFSNATNLLTITSILATLLLISIILKSPPKSYWNSIGLAYLLGGTVGNGIDRLLKGYVLDFLELVPINFPIFNLADVSINIAIICFIIDLTKDKSRIKH
nr:signal peptidase II [Prochlorococcus marinus]